MSLKKIWLKMTTLIKILKTRYIGVVMVVWVLSLLYMGLVGNNNEAPLDNMKLELYEKTMKQLLELREQNKKLSNHIQDLEKTQEMLQYNKKPGYKKNEKIEIVKATQPSQEHEIMRRRVHNDIRETWFYIDHQLESLKNMNKITDLTDKLHNIQQNLYEYYSISSNDMIRLSHVDGAGAWRKEQSQSLANIVQDVIYKLQNPVDCNTAKILVCNLGKGCGFGCQLHHLLFCFITAMATKRTFVLNSKNWRYLNDGWSQFFIPPSTKCHDNFFSSPPYWTGHDENIRVIQLPIIDVLQPRPNFLPLSVPSQLYNALITIHGDPFVWWAGQLLNYLMRPQPSLAADISAVDAELGFSLAPHIVGVHVRRTDKLTSEAAFHSLSEYMWHVEKYYEKLDLLIGQVTPRAIYLASDDPKVFQEAIQKYPKYKVIGNQKFAEHASLHSRYSKDSLRAIILDIHFLSQTNHLVCTFSSQVSRLAYELMQTLHRDDATSFKSLDDIYYYGGQSGHKQVVRFDHTTEEPGYLSLVKGQTLGVAGNHWDGFSMGEVSGTGVRGLYPSIKVLERVSKSSFDIFDDFFRSDEYKVKYGGNGGVDGLIGGGGDGDGNGGDGRAGGDVDNGGNEDEALYVEGNENVVIG